MTRRATFTQAELARAIKAAEATGKIAVQTPAGIAFLAPENVAHPAPMESAQADNTCDGAFGTGSA